MGLQELFLVGVGVMVVAWVCDHIFERDDKDHPGDWRKAIKKPKDMK